MIEGCRIYEALFVFMVSTIFKIKNEGNIYSSTEVLCMQIYLQE